jgi:hypothetical protein
MTSAVDDDRVRPSRSHESGRVPDSLIPALLPSPVDAVLASSPATRDDERPPTADQPASNVFAKDLQDDPYVVAVTNNHEKTRHVVPHWEISNPKLEIRRNPEIRSTKQVGSKPVADFLLVPSFEFRISCFGFSPRYGSRSFTVSRSDLSSATVLSIWPRLNSSTWKPLNTRHLSPSLEIGNPQIRPGSIP